MQRVGSKENMIKQLMVVLGNTVEASRSKEALNILQNIAEYRFTPNATVYFYYDSFSDDEMCLTENEDKVDWEADLIVEMMLSNKEGEGYGVALHYA